MPALSPIVLNSPSGSLAITTDERGVGGWCQVHLTQLGVSRLLGAERLKYSVVCNESMPGFQSGTRPLFPRLTPPSSYATYVAV